MIRLRIICVLLFTISFKPICAQKWELGVDAGRAYFQYKYRDEGSGFLNEPNISYGLTAGTNLVRNIGENRFAETGLRFALYQQYYSTRKYLGAWEQTYPVIHIPFLYGIKSKTKKLGYRVSAGFLIGIMPDQYVAEYGATMADINGVLDSVTRGIMYRNFTPIFPLLNLNASLQYRISKKFNADLKVGYGKGFIRISEYDIYYNNGSGINDQNAKQWGKGDFLAMTIGVRYSLRQQP